MGPFRGVLLDWDGTLVDSAEASYRCYKAVVESFGIPYTRAAFAETYATDWHHTYAQMGLGQELWNTADDRWFGFYRAETTRLLPEAIASLERLSGLGLRLGLVTGGDRKRVGDEIDRLGVRRFLETVVTRDDVPFLKPHPAPLLRGLEDLELQPHEAAYVGDSPEDMLMSRAAGVFSVGFLGGFPNQEALRATDPDRLAKSLSEAVEAIVREGVVGSSSPR